MSPKVLVRSAGFSYGNKEVWRDVNLVVEQGETICLLGPNGCGKTTLLNCIHGDLALRHGEIQNDGRDVAAMTITERARNMGYVFQEQSVPFPYSCLEVVRMGRAPYLGLFQVPSKRDSELARNIMEEMGIGHLADKRYSMLSGGERQLVVIARTLCQQPQIILFDEPTSHLDFKNQALILRTIKRLAGRGLTIIMTSHFPNHAWLLDSRVALMGQNGILVEGPAERVMTEENLSETYGLRVKVFEVKDGDTTVHFCTPEYRPVPCLTSRRTG